MHKLEVKFTIVVSEASVSIHNYYYYDNLITISMDRRFSTAYQVFHVNSVGG